MITKSIKSRMHEKQENWMLAGDVIVNGVAKEPTRQLVAEWAVEVYKNHKQYEMHGRRAGLNGFNFMSSMCSIKWLN